DVRLLETFHAVVDHRFVTQAAAVRVTQPAVSAQIARLEQGRSFPLFDRSNERLKPPAEGMLFGAEVDKELTGHFGLVTRPFEPAIYYEIGVFCPRHREPSILAQSSCRC